MNAKRWDRIEDLSRLTACLPLAADAVVSVSKGESTGTKLGGGGVRLDKREGQQSIGKMQPMALHIEGGRGPDCTLVHASVSVQTRFDRTIGRARVWIALRSIAAIAFAGVIAGCGGGQDTREFINGIAVPPTPETVANQATVGGVDTNGNGIRDDVDRMLATEFGQSAPAYQEATTYARTQQAALSNPTQATIAAHIALLRCVRDPQKLADLKKVTLANLDGPVRRRAYAQAFAGVVISSTGCPQ